MFNTLINWFRRRPVEAPVNAGAATEMQHPLQRYYLGPKGEGLPSAAGARRRGETNKLADGLTETLLYRLEEPEWLERRTLVGPYGAGMTPFRRTRYWPWGAERLRVASSYDADEQPQVEVHEYFPTGELRRHRRLTPQARTTLYAFREPREEGEEYTYIEQMPQFPGGMEQLMQDLGRFTKYPAAALRAGVQGKVPVHFMLGPDGVMRDFSAAPDAHPLLAQAALDALRQIGRTRRWQPGMQNRRCVAVSYTVPVTFTIR